METQRTAGIARQEQPAALFLQLAQGDGKALRLDVKIRRKPFKAGAEQGPVQLTVSVAGEGADEELQIAVEL